jgi:hypothetical protein
LNEVLCFLLYKKCFSSIDGVELHSAHTKPVLLFIYFEIRSHSLAQAGLGLMNLLPLPPEYWDYRPEPPCLTMFLFSNEGTEVKHGKYLVQGCIVIEGHKNSLSCSNPVQF